MTKRQVYVDLRYGSENFVLLVYDSVKTEKLHLINDEVLEGEHPIDCAFRICKEKTGLEVFNLKQKLTLRDDRNDIVSFFYSGLLSELLPEIKNKNKKESCQWHDWPTVEDSKSINSEVSIILPLLRYSNRYNVLSRQDLGRLAVCDVF